MILLIRTERQILLDSLLKRERPRGPSKSLPDPIYYVPGFALVFDTRETTVRDGLQVPWLVSDRVWI